MFEILVSAVLFTCGNVAYATDKSGFNYSISTFDYGDGSPEYPCLTIEKYTGSDKELYISDSLFTDEKGRYDAIRVEENAIVDCDELETIIFSKNVERIIYNGISKCDSLKKAVFLGRDTVIDNLNGVYDDESFTIYGFSNSTAWRYAEIYKLSFVELKADSLVLDSTSEKNGIKFTWNDFGADSYSIYEVSTDGQSEEIYTGKALSYSYSSDRSGLLNYYITANFDDFKFKSNTITLFFGKISELDKPVVTKKESGMSVKLSWKKVSGATEYTIFYCKKGEKEYKILDTTTKTNYTYTADEKGTYYFKVTAKETHDGILTAESERSAPITATLKYRTLSTPVLSQKNFGGVSVRLSWKKVSGATDYEIYCARNGSNFDLINTTDKLYYTFTADMKGYYSFKVKANNYSNGKLTGQSARSKTVTAKLNENRFVVEDTGYYRNVQKTDPEYKMGLSFTFVNGSHKVGTEIPSGWYVLYPTDKNKGYSAFNGKKPGVAYDLTKPQYTVGSNTGDELMVYAEEGAYLTLQGCRAVKYNARIALPTGKNSCIIWKGVNFTKGKYQLKYDGTYSGTYNGIKYYNAMSGKIFDSETGKLIKTLDYDVRTTKKPTVSLKEGQILVLEFGATL